MHIAHSSPNRRRARLTRAWATLSIALLAVSALIAAGGVQQDKSKTHPKTEQSGSPDKAKDSHGSPAAATEQAPSDGHGQGVAGTSGQNPAQSGSQQPFVIPDKPMCPCPLVTKDPVEPHFQEVCGRCHTPDRITGTKKSGLEWKETIEKMIQKGAQVNDDDYDVILAFLIRNFDRVDINWIEPGELVAALGLTKDEAEKIVAYRKQHGDFKDFDSLAKVPGVDVTKLQAKKSSIVFQ